MGENGEGGRGQDELAADSRRRPRAHALDPTEVNAV